MGPITIQKDNVDQLPPYNGSRDIPPWSLPPYRPRLDWRVVAVLCVFVLIGGWLISGEVKAWLDDGWRERLFWLGFVALFLFLVRRAALIEQPGGFRVPFWQLDARPVVRGALEVQQSYASTPFRQVAAYTLTNPHAPALPESEQEIIEIGPDIGPLARHIWLEWLDTRPHAMFAGPTGVGKSTVAKAGLKMRIASGEQVFVIDPHSNGWFSLPSVGGGENWAEVEEGMRAVIALYHERQQERDRFLKETGRELPHNHFPRLTVVFDEANDAYEQFSRLYNGSRKRTSPWQPFAVALSSGARKVGIAVWLLLQSPNVEDLGMSGPKRENFTRFALDPRTIGMMIDKDERNIERRRALNSAIAGMSFPATVCKDAEVYLLDRTDLDKISPPAHSERAAWDGWPIAIKAPQQFPPWCQSVAARAYYLGKTTKMSTREIRDAVRGDQNTVIKAVAAARNGG